MDRGFTSLVLWREVVVCCWWAGSGSAQRPSLSTGEPRQDHTWKKTPGWRYLWQWNVITWCNSILIRSNTEDKASHATSSHFYCVTLLIFQRDAKYDSPHVHRLRLGREASVAGKVDHDGSVWRKLSMSGSDEDEELRHRRLVQQVLVRVLAFQNNAAIFLNKKGATWIKRHLLVWLSIIIW